MSTHDSIPTPNYAEFVHAIGPLDLPISASELHGIMCGYLCADRYTEGETYIRMLTTKHKKDAAIRAALLAMFALYHYSHQQFEDSDFEFILLVPDDNEPLIERAKAFSEWCEGFTQGLTLGHIAWEKIDEDSEDAITHIREFAQLDYDSLSVSEEDERSLFEINEYTRMAVLQLSQELKHLDDDVQKKH